MGNNKQKQTFVGYYGVYVDKRKKRSVISRARLKEAFISLLKTKEPEEITVCELCEKAELNRSTFYSHYEYMDTLIQEIITDRVVRICRQSGPGWSREQYNGIDKSDILRYLNLFLDDWVLLYFCTCRENWRYRSFVIQSHVTTTIDMTSASVEYYAAYFQNTGVINLILEWVNNGMPISQDKLAEIIQQFSRSMWTTL